MRRKGVDGRALAADRKPFRFSRHEDSRRCSRQTTGMSKSVPMA